MALDPSIALGYKGIEAPNPLAQYAQVAQIQNAQNQNALNQYQLAAAKRTDEQTNVMNELYAKHFNPATGTLNQNALNADLIARNQAGQIPVMQAKFADTEHKAATAQKAKIDAVAEERKFVEGAQRNLSTNPSDANITAWLEDSRLSPVLSAQTKAQLEKEAASLLAMKPAQRVDYLSQRGATASDFTTRRGQNMVDARARENIQIAKDRETRLAQGPIGTSLTPEQNEALFGENGAATTGKINPNKINSRNAKMWADAFLKNPSANPVKVAQEVAASDAAVKSFLGDGKAAQEIKSTNTAVGHLQSLKDLYAAQQNGDMRAFNAAANAISAEFGGAAPTNLQTAVQIVGPEIAKSVIGTAGSMKEREEFVKALSGKAASPAQFAGAIDTTTGLLTTRLSEVENSYKRQTKRDDFRSTFLNPTSRAILERSAEAAKPSAVPTAKPAAGGAKFLGFEP